VESVTDKEKSCPAVQPTEDGLSDQPAKRQERLKEKLQKKAELDRKRSDDLKRKRQQAIELIAVLTEDIMQGGDQILLDAIDSLFQVLEWEKAYWPKGTPEQEPSQRLKVHLAACLPNYQQALRICMEQKKAQEAGYAS
jgi:hypothetical protein